MITENQHTEWKESWLAVHPSKPNNPDVANAFFRAGMIESWGRGIEKIIDLCISVGLPKPVFDTSFGGLQIEFVPNSESEVNKARVETRVEMSEKILALIRNTPEITIMTLVDQIGKSHVTIEKILKDLQKAKKIERVGPT